MFNKLFINKQEKIYKIFLIKPLNQLICLESGKEELLVSFLYAISLDKMLIFL